MAEQLQVIRWEAPAPNPRGPSAGFSRPHRFTQIVAAMRDKPGEWAVVWEKPGRLGGSLATAIRTGQYRCFQPAGSFEAVTRMRDGVQAVHARYVGALREVRDA